MTITTKTSKIKGWESYFIECIKTDLALEYDLEDNAIKYVFGVSISPKLKTLDQENLLLVNALQNENGGFLNKHLSSFQFDEINISYDGMYKSCDDLALEIQTLYKGEEWGMVNYFDIQSHNSLDIGYVGYNDVGKYFYHLPENPNILFDGLNLFNTLSFENPTHILRLQTFWRELQEVRDLAFNFKNLPKNYDRLFVSAENVALNPLTTKNITKIIVKANSFFRKYQIPREDFFNIRESLNDWGKGKLCFAKNAFEYFLTCIMYSYMAWPNLTTLVSRCDQCGDFFPYSKGKKFCSLLGEGKDCGKAARNKRHYLKNRKNIIKKARSYNKELSVYYKAKGIKKYPY